MNIRHLLTCKFSLFGKYYDLQIKAPVLRTITLGWKEPKSRVQHDSMSKG